jgi:hypothetical protein
VIERIGLEIEQRSRTARGHAQRLRRARAQGYFTDIVPDREALAATASPSMDVQETIQSPSAARRHAHVEGRERYPVNVRYERDFRSDLPALGRVLVRTPRRAGAARSAVATVRRGPGPAMIRDEDGQLAGYIYVDTDTPDIGGYVARAQGRSPAPWPLPPGYTLDWTGPVRVPGPRARAAAGGAADRPRDIFCCSTMTFRSFSEVGHRHAVGRLRDDRRRAAAVVARLQLLGRRLGRLHRALRHRRPDRRRDGRLPARGARRAAWAAAAR